jgi:hypothetical protein
MTKKVYFASTPWATAAEQLANFIHQTPNNSGIWDNIEAVNNQKQADYVIVMDEATEAVDTNKVIFFGREPKHVVGAYKEWNKPCVGKYHHEYGNSWLAMTWWTKLPFNQLVELQPEKTKSLSIIDSGKRFTEFHNYRLDLIRAIMKANKENVDVFGGIVNNQLPHRDKTKGLETYRYNLAIENGRTDFYFSEKLCDPLLFLTMPIYCGCKNIQKFFPSNSYVLIDPSKSHDYNAKMIKEVVASNVREENIESLKEARHLVLYKYNIWNTISLAVNNGAILP